MARKHAAHEEEHENHERWLVTYADMITLLMVLFIVMFAMSSVDQRKFNALKAGLAAGFGQSTSVLDGSESILDEPGTSAAQPIDPRRVEDTPQIAELKVNAVSQNQQVQADQQYAEAATEAERLLRIRKRVMKALRAHGLQGDVRTTIDGRGLTVSLVSRNVVFQPNIATLTPRGRLIVHTVAPVLRDIPDDLQIEGHTNQAPGAPKYYPSDWDLSTARAVTVLRYLNEQEQVPAKRLAAVGYGHIKPLVDPDKPGSQWLNKRVDIVVVSTISEESRKLLAQVLADRGVKPGAGTPTTREEKP
ncbi:MAG: chemotaxis protein MotB [Nocardioidaceae bacterium]|nr:chemotaxis protein MotB [Nocardioidaceae bacterium]